jgi:FdhD protein
MSAVESEKVRMRAYSNSEQLSTLALTPTLSQWEREQDKQMPEIRPIFRWRAGTSAERADDELAHEEPLEIRVRGRAISVTMRTPGHDEELAAGFLATEGMISRRADVLRIEPCGRNEDGNLVNVQLAPEVAVDFDKLTRHVFASSSCGLCGKATIDAVKGQFPAITSDLVVDAQTVLGLPEKMRQTQATFDRTGGLHAAAIFSASGELIVLREDVGRHNALDKVIGYGLLNGLLPYDNHILLVSGRTSFEIIQKALAARVPIIAAVSAPSSLAVDFAKESGQTLIGFLRGERMNIYAGEQRIRFTPR